MYEMVRFLYEIKTRHLRVASGERCMQNKITYFLFLISLLSLCRISLELLSWSPS